MGEVEVGLLNRARATFLAFEGPTWLLALAVYGAWGALAWFHGSIPWYLLLPAGACVKSGHDSHLETSSAAAVVKKVWAGQLVQRADPVVALNLPGTQPTQATPLPAFSVQLSLLSRQYISFAATATSDPRPSISLSYMTLKVSSPLSAVIVPL